MENILAHHRACFVWFGLGLACAAQAMDAATLRARMEAAYYRVPRKVLAFYYPWYGLASFSGRNRHFGKIDTEKHDIAAMRHYPAIGPFDSHDPQVVAYHMRLAREAGVDGFIVSWWGQGDFTDRAMPIILSEAAKAGREITVYLEVVKKPISPQSAAEDLVYIVRTYGDHPAFLKVEGRPVIFAYGRTIAQLGVFEWAKAIELAQQRLGRKICVIGDQLSKVAAAVFDGIHTYNVAGLCRGRTPEEAARATAALYRPASEAARRFRRIFAATVIPGYDDTKVRSPGLAVDRHGGKLYDCLWRAAMELDPDWILITSWNEWHEGSEIEPSLELGDYYIKATARLAREFKARPRKAHPRPAPSAFTELELASLRRALARLRIGLLPGASSPAAFWLIENGIEFDTLSWEELVRKQPTGEDFDLLVYAAGERYTNTVNEPGDVDRALQRYLRSGGILFVLPDGPLPFYYDAQGRTVNAARKFGMPLTVSSPRGAEPVQDGRPRGWEEPPPGLGELHFEVNTELLPHLPRRFPFPTVGDLRWRPWVAADVPPRVNAASLIKLKGGRGRYLGDAVAAAAIDDSEGAGGVLYVWFRLLDGPYAEQLLYDLFSLVARR